MCWFCSSVLMVLWFGWRFAWRSALLCSETHTDASVSGAVNSRWGVWEYRDAPETHTHTHSQRHTHTHRDTHTHTLTHSLTHSLTETHTHTHTHTHSQRHTHTHRDTHTHTQTHTHRDTHTHTHTHRDTHTHSQRHTHTLTETHTHTHRDTHTHTHTHTQDPRLCMCFNHCCLMHLLFHYCTIVCVLERVCMHLYTHTHTLDFISHLLCHVCVRFPSMLSVSHCSSEERSWLNPPWAAPVMTTCVLNHGKSLISGTFVIVQTSVERDGESDISRTRRRIRHQ